LSRKSASKRLKIILKTKVIHVMKKYSLYLKIALFITLSVVFVACPEPIYEECTWERKTTGMIGFVAKGDKSIITDDYSHNFIYLNINDTCSYDSLIINLHFNTEYISQKTCSSPQDSIVGKIRKLNIFCINKYNDNFIENSLLNSFIDVFYEKENGMMSQEPIFLDSYLAIDPICNASIELFLNLPPDTTRLQQFIIEYEEDDGTKYQDTTQSIYVKP
jgi:hypothetical protein